jgi:hypothetical protein
MIYVHSAVGAMKRGALRIFREMYMKADPQRQTNLLKIHVMQPSKILNMRMFVAEKCSKEARIVFEKIF